MKTNQDMRLKVQRVFFILRGLFAGATTHKNFALLFDWFYPEYWGVIKKCLTMYIQAPCDDDIVLLILKFLDELVDNTSNRLRFDTWSINGLIVYKESASFVLEFIQIFNCLEPSAKPLRHGDQYKEVFRFQKVLMKILQKYINGDYINFAICEYYDDQTFTQVSQSVF